MKPALSVLSSLRFSDDPTDKSQYGEEQDSGYDSDMYDEESMLHGLMLAYVLTDGSNPRLSTTTSLDSAITAYKYENGRRYHAYKAGSRYP